MVAVGNGLTVIVTTLDVAGLPDTFGRFDVITAYTLSPCAGVQVYVALDEPATLLPFRYHSYVGLPPLIGVAVKVTEVPAQTAPAGRAAMFTPACKSGFTVIMMEFDVAGVKHGKSEVITTVIASPLAGA
jgi:hypothetical protein